MQSLRVHMKLVSIDVGGRGSFHTLSNFNFINILSSMSMLFWCTIYIYIYMIFGFTGIDPVATERCNLLLSKCAHHFCRLEKFASLRCLFCLCTGFPFYLSVLSLCLLALLYIYIFSPHNELQCIIFIFPLFLINVMMFCRHVY